MDSSTDDIATLRAEVALARAKMAEDAATIARQNLEIAKLRRQLYGPRSERTFRLLDQMELELEDLEVAATEDEIAAERAAAKTTTVAAFTRKRPARQPFPAHLPRERVIVPGPTACACCGGDAPEEARRDHHRDAGGDPAPMEGHPARAREDDVPGLREDQRATGAVPRHAARLGRAASSGDAAV